MVDVVNPKAISRPQNQLPDCLGSAINVHKSSSCARGNLVNVPETFRSNFSVTDRSENVSGVLDFSKKGNKLLIKTERQIPEETHNENESNIISNVENRPLDAQQWAKGHCCMDAVANQQSVSHKAISQYSPACTDSASTMTEDRLSWTSGSNSLNESYTRYGK
ncbi:hypothetical protein PoB_001721300 [Plakobranchus ocellatus]|uniref:SHSP domain-containing protein n=1 Tax=Plakobranchus ocellatus TaxID=259542 RepID=A0AAV3Z7K2_9GAST|nr:hypothetical protein PoB_001721300 [Plakobranchus ocellatus]